MVLYILLELVCATPIWKIKTAKNWQKIDIFFPKWLRNAYFAQFWPKIRDNTGRYVPAILKNISAQKLTFFSENCWFSSILLNFDLFYGRYVAQCAQTQLKINVQKIDIFFRKLRQNRLFPRKFALFARISGKIWEKRDLPAEKQKLQKIDIFFRFFSKKWRKQA